VLRCFGDPRGLAADSRLASARQSRGGSWLDELERGSLAGIHLNALTRQRGSQLVSARDAWNGVVLMSTRVLEYAGATRRETT